MKASTTLLTLGVISAASYGAVRALRHVRAKQFERNLDAVLTDLDDEVGDQVVITEEVVMFTETEPSTFRTS